MELCKAIILKSINYSDTQKIIHVYTLEKGYLSMISSSLLFKKKSQPLHLMQVVEIEYFENEKSNLHKLKSTFPIANLSNLYFDIFKMNIILLWGEILELLLKNEGKNENLIEYLNTLATGIGNFNLFFLYRLTRLLGFQINTSSWQEGYVFNINDGNFSPADNTSAYISGPNTAKVIYLLCTCEVNEINKIPLNQSSRNILLDIILSFYSIHLNLNFNIKSIQVIREIFQ